MNLDLCTGGRRTLSVDFSAMACILGDPIRSCVDGIGTSDRRDVPIADGRNVVDFCGAVRMRLWRLGDGGPTMPSVTGRIRLAKEPWYNARHQSPTRRAGDRPLYMLMPRGPGCLAGTAME